MYDFVQIPTGANQVTDADEEVLPSLECPNSTMLTERSQVFLLYTRLAATPQSETMGGLGYVDSRSPVLNVNFELDLSTDPSASHSNHRKSSRVTKSRKQDMTIEVQLAQDPSSLRSRKGDTGSVLWRARFSLPCSMRTD